MPEGYLDLKGLKCPLPALRTRAALGTLSPGDVLVVQSTDPLAAIDIPNMVRETGDILDGQHRTDLVLTFRIRKSDGSFRPPPKLPDPQTAD